MFKDNNFFKNARCPLDQENIEILADELDWSELQWGENSLIVKDMRYGPLKNYKYYLVNEQKY